VIALDREAADTELAALARGGEARAESGLPPIEQS
jgi:hypothetical protein